MISLLQATTLVLAKRRGGETLFFSSCEGLGGWAGGPRGLMNWRILTWVTMYYCLVKTL